MNQHQTPQNSKQREQQTGGSKGQSISKQILVNQNDRSDNREDIIAKNATMISDMVNSERKTNPKQFYSPDKDKTTIQLSIGIQKRSQHLYSKDTASKKPQSVTKAQESQTLSHIKITNHSSIMQNNNSISDSHLPHISENNQKLIEKRKLSNTSYLFKEEEDIANLSLGNQGYNIISLKKSNPSIGSYFAVEQGKQRNQNLIKSDQQRLQQSQSLNQTGIQNGSINQQQQQLSVGNNSMESFSTFNGQLNNNQQQTSKVFHNQTQTSLYQLDLFMRSQMKDNIGGIDNTSIINVGTLQTSNNLTSKMKFHKQNINTSAQNTSKHSNAQSARDISFIKEQRFSLAKQTEERIKTKTDFNVNFLLSPKSQLQDQKSSLFTSRKCSYSDLKTNPNNQKEKKISSGFTSNFLNTPMQSQKNLTLPLFRSSQELSSPLNEQGYNLMPHLPNNFIEEFLQIVKETNSVPDQQSNSQNHLAFINKGQSSSNTQVLKSIHQEIQNILANQTIVSIQTNIPSSLTDLAISLKHYHPNLYSGQPSGRAEVDTVKNWLEMTFDQIQSDKNLHIKEKFQKLDDSLILTFNELVRQVSYHCKERGMLLITVFSCYFSLIKKVSQYEQEEKRNLNIQNQYEKLLLQKNADDDIENKNNQIKALQELLLIEQNKTAQLEKELKIQEEREKGMFQKCEKIKKINDIAKVQLIKMKREMDDLRSRLQSKEMFQQKKLEKFLLEYKSNLKRQASTAYYSVRTQEKIEEQDQELIKILLEIPNNNKLKHKASIDDIEDYLQLSFTDLIKEVDDDARNIQNDVIIKQVYEEKSDALVCQGVQTDPMMSLTYTKSIKTQTDLDLAHIKYDAIFANKSKVDEFIRESKIKQDLFALEESQDQFDTSIDQENGQSSQRNYDKPMLSNLFAGLPIKKLKKKMPKAQLERFIENMGVLYSYIKEPETNLEKDRTENLKNMIQQNIRQEELKDLISMREIKEVDEVQEVEAIKVQRSKQRNNTYKQDGIVPSSKFSSQTNIPPPTLTNIPPAQTNIPPLQTSVASPQSNIPSSQTRNVEFKRNNTRVNTLSKLKKEHKIVQALNIQEKNLLREQIKQQFEINFYQSQSNQQLIEQIQKQQKIIEQISPFALEEESLNNSLNNSRKINQSFSPQNKSSQNKLRASVQGSFQDQVQSQSQSPTHKVSFQTSFVNSPAGSKVQGNINSVQGFNSVNTSTSRKIQLIPALPKSSGQKYVNSASVQDLGEGPSLNGFNQQNHTQYQQIIQQNTSISMQKIDETNNSILSQDQILPSELQTSFVQDKEIKLQVMSLLQLYNMEIEKNSNLRESLEELIKLLRELYQFLKLLFIHIKKTQKHTHKSIIEGFIQQFTSIKWKLPKEFDTNFDREILKDEKEDDKKKSLRLKFSNKKSTIKFLAYVQRNQAFTKMTQFDKSTHFGFILVNRIKEQGIPKKYSTFLPLKNTLKYIQNLVDERVRMIREGRLPKDQEMPIFTFNKFLQIFGFKKVAENKYSQFLMSVVHYQSIFRVNVFARLLTILFEKKSNYSSDEMEKYFQAYEFINNISTMGVLNPQHSETDSTFMVPLLKALDYIKVILEKIMPFEDIIELRQQLENMKVIDLKSANKTPIVDFDVFMSKVLSKYRILMSRTQLFVKNAFFAADLDGNGRINLNEYLTLYRHIMSNKFNLMKCIKIFEEKADIITEEEKNLSFEKFTAVCIDYNLFTTQMQDKYINVTNKDDIQTKIEELKNSWNDESQNIKQKIEMLKPFVVPESYKNWIEILKVLEHRIIDEQILDENQRPILIAHKLLNDELQRLIDEGKKGGENEEDDDDDEDIFNFQEDDDNTDLQMILKSMNSKNNQSQIFNGTNITIQEQQNQYFEEELSRNDTQQSTSRMQTQPKYD